MTKQTAGTISHSDLWEAKELLRELRGCGKIKQIAKLWEAYFKAKLEFYQELSKHPEGAEVPNVVSDLKATARRKKAEAREADAEIRQSISALKSLAIGLEARLELDGVRALAEKRSSELAALMVCLQGSHELVRNRADLAEQGERRRYGFLKERPLPNASIEFAELAYLKSASDAIDSLLSQMRWEAHARMKPLSSTKKEQREKNKEARALGLSKYKGNACEEYLDYVSALSQRERLIEMSRPNLLVCTDEGVRRWTEKRRKQEKQAQEELRKRRQQSDQARARVTRNRMSCHRAPSWIAERVTDNPQAPIGTGPGAPLAIPFTIEEVQTAVREVIRAGDYWLGEVMRAFRGAGTQPPTCPAAIDAANVRIAEYTHQYLVRHTSSNGWVKIDMPGARGAPKVIEVDLGPYIAKMFGDASVPPTLKPPTGGVYDLTRWTTTFTLRSRMTNRTTPIFFGRFPSPAPVGRSAAAPFRPDTDPRVRAAPHRVPSYSSILAARRAAEPWRQPR